MLFTKSFLKGKRLPIVLFLLVLVIGLPLFSVQASVGLLYFRANPAPNFIMLEWETGQETDNFGFNLYKGLTSDFEDAQRLNSNLIPSQSNGPLGAYYDWQDNDVVVGTQYTYWLEDIDIFGNPTVHEPDTASPGGGNTIPTIPAPGGGNSTATPTPTRTPTRTPTATTQAGTNATQTPTRTPAPAVSPTSSNPTPTTAGQVQATTATNSVSATSVSTSNNTSTEVAPANGYPAEEPTEDVVQSAQPTAETTESEEDVAAESLAQAASEEEVTDASAPSFQQIGGNDSETEEATVGEASDEGSGRSTAVLMALIASVVLLFIGGGGVVALLLNRTKQTRT